MKKIFVIISCFLFIFISIFVIQSSLASEVSANFTNGYAVVKNNNSYFYRYTLDNPAVNNKYFLLEKSYFVKILENVDDYFYKAEYNGIKGYVKKIDVEFVEEIPENPYLCNITFDVYSGSSVELRTEPSTENGIGSIITTLPSGLKNLNYFGKLTGEESIKGLGNIWIYCSYLTPENEEIFGYIYSPLTVNLSPINENSEQLTVVSVNDYFPLNSLLYLSLSTKNLIIIAITIPSLYIAYLFIKPTKILKE